MDKTEKALRKLENSKDRREKNIKRSQTRLENRRLNLENCPFDVEMNGLYGTCTCGGDDRESCAMSV